MKIFDATTAVVTGAAAGMGRSLALQLVAAGADVALCDVDGAGLAETARLCADAGGQVLTSLVDVREEAAVTGFADEVVDRFGRVDALFNNAGVAFSGTFERSTTKDLARIVDIDFWGVVHGTRAFLPHLVAAPQARIVNTSSVFGLFAVPSQGAYNAAKFAVRGFTESLRQEMLLTHPHVKVSCVHPGGIRTDIARNATSASGEIEAGHRDLFDRIAVTSSDRAARIILRGAARGRPRILVGPDAVAADALVRLVGPRYQRPLAWAVGRSVPEWFGR